MSMREVLKAASGLLLVLAAGIFFSALFLWSVALPADIDPENAARFLFPLFFSLGLSMTVAGVLARALGEEAKK